MTVFNRPENAPRWDLRLAGGAGAEPEFAAGEFVDQAVLRSSLAPAGLPDVLVRRQRLIDQLTLGARSRAVTLICAPAGTGKSVLAAMWFAQAEEGWARGWLTAGEHTATSASFWCHFMQAMTEQGIALERSRWAEPAATFDVSFLVQLAADLLDSSRQFVLVVDDFDRVTNAAVLDGLDFLVRHAYPRFRLVLCTRSQPRLPIQRYCLADSLARIGTRDLAFTTAEATQLLRASAIAATPEWADEATRRTGGWAVGLRLIAMSLQRWGEPVGGGNRFSEPEGARTESDDGIGEYLRREVIEPLPAILRGRLTRLCVADELPPDLVEALTGLPDGAHVLADLARRGVFLECGDQAAPGYRLHPVMRAVLRTQLQRDEPDSAARLHDTCATWLVARDQPVAALRHAAASGAWSEICDLIVQDLRVASLIYPGSSGGQADADVLPAEVPGANAALVRAALAVERGEASLAAEHLLTAGRLAATVSVPVEFAFCAGLVALAGRAAGGGHIDTSAAAQIHRLWTDLSDEQRAAHADLAMVVALFSALGAASADSEDAAAAVLDAALADWSALPDVGRGSSRLALRCMNVLAVLQAVRGCLRSAHNHAASTQRLAISMPARVRPDLFGQRLALAWTATEECDYTAAARWATHAREDLRRHPDELLAPLLAVVDARMLSAKGHCTEALHLLAVAEDASLPASWVRRCIVLESAQTHVLLAHPTAALAALVSLGREPSVRQEALRLRIAAVSGQPVSNGALRDDPALSPQSRIDVLLALAVVHNARGDVQRAATATRKALEVAESETLRRPLVESAVQVRDLGNALAAETGAGRLPVGAAPMETATRQATPPRPAADLIEQLTGRETEVLRYLAELYSTQEIAAAMFVSTNTVRTHVRGILRKLDASRRNLAVRRARALGLI